jgi:tRNA A37 methylthiotransferase MiaB
MKIGFVSLGCPKNLVDGEVMLGMARDAGHTITADATDADVIVVNTCAFIDNAKEESIDAILEMARLKRDGGCKSLIVTGCLAERYRDALKREIPEIDVCLGTGEVPEIVGAIAGTARPLQIFRSMTDVRVRDAAADFNPPPGTRAAADAHVPPVAGPTYLYDASTPRVLTTPSHYAYLKVAEGCDYTCAFIDNAKEESIDAILEMAQLKKDGRAKKLIVTGCLAERYREQLVVGRPVPRAAHAAKHVRRRVLQRKVDVLADLLALRHRGEDVVGDCRGIEIQQADPRESFEIVQSAQQPGERSSLLTVDAEE